MPDPFGRGRRLLLRPVLWLLVYGGLTAYGVYALLHIPVEVLPQFDYPQISVIAHYPGATATELSPLLARPLEGQILTLPDVVSVRAVMGHGTLQIDVRFRAGGVAQQDLQAVNGAIDRARSRLPGGIQPRAEIMGNAINEVADYTVKIPAAVAPVAVQRAIETSVVPALRALPGVQKVEVYGSGDPALWVQPKLARLRQYGVTLPALARTLKAQVALNPAGYLRLGHQDVALELRALPVTATALADVPVPAPQGPVPLHDLAGIVRAPLPTRVAVSLDGRPSIALTVFKQPGASTLPVTRAIRATLSATRAELPGGVSWVRTYSQGHLVGLIGSDLGRDLSLGALLAIAVLFWILGAGRGVWVLALSIPLALLLGIGGLYMLHQSLNLMTLGALSVAVGLLADDAIIVLESIYHRWEQSDGHWFGVWQGLKDIASPDISGTVTTVSVFLPLLFVGGLAGLFFVPFALAMALALLASLLISLTLIPLLLGFIRAQPRRRPNTGLQWLAWLQRRNQRLLELAIRHPRAALLVCGVLLGLSLAGLALVPVNFLPLPNEGVMLESFTLPPGSSLRETEATVARLIRRLHQDPAVAHSFARIGSPERSGYTEPASAGEIQIVLKPAVAANSLDRIAQRLLRETRMTGVLVSIDTPTVERLGESLSGLPQPFVIRLFGPDSERLRNLSQAVVQRLRQVPALTDVFNNDAYAVTQLIIHPRPAALVHYGLTPAQLYDQLEPALAGKIVAEVPDGNAPLALYLRLADAHQLSLAALRRLPIKTRGWTPLGELASVRLVATPNQIRDIDGARALEILATPLAPLGRVIAAARGALRGLQLPAGYRIDFGGLFPQLEHAALGLAIAAGAAFLLMLGILLLQFDGLLIPGLLLLQIPLAFTGGAAALVISGVGLNATGLVAFLTLIGIGLNHGIVLLYRVQRSEAAGSDVETAVREAVQVRFRPILLTTLTALLGMLPTALAWGRGAAPEQGLAVVIMGGILWSALLSTNLIPALYLHRRQRKLARKG